jgi:hypothetical protein
LLRINNGFTDYSWLFSFFWKDSRDDFHDLWNHRWESLENLVDNCACNILKHTVRVLYKFQSWIPKFFKLRID